MDIVSGTSIKVFGVGHSAVDKLTNVSKLGLKNVTTVLADGNSEVEKELQDVGIAIIYVGDTSNVAEVQTVGAIAKNMGVLTIGVTKPEIHLDTSSVGLSIITYDDTAAFLESVVRFITNLLDTDNDICIEYEDLKNFISGSSIGEFSFYDEVDGVRIKSTAKRLLVSVTAEDTVSLEAVYTLMNDIADKLSPDAEMLWGLKLVKSLEKKTAVSIIAIG